MNNLPVLHSKKWGLDNVEYNIESRKIDSYKYEKRIPEALVQYYVNTFTLAGRSWQAYSVDKVEVMLRYVGLLNGPEYYRTYDVDTRELVFQGSIL